MNDETKNKFMTELVKLHQQIEELKTSEAKHQLMEETLQTCKREWECTFEAMSDWVTLLTPEALVLRSNQAGEELLNMAPVKMVGQHCCKLVHGTDEPIPGCPLQKTLQSRQREIIDLHMPDEDRWLTVTVDPVLDDDNKIVSAVHIVRDITQRKQIEAELIKHHDHLEDLVTERSTELRRSEDKFRNIFEQSPIGIELYDAKGELIDANQACLDIFGIADVGEVKGFKLFTDPNIPDEIKERLARKEVVRYEITFDFDKARELNLYKTSKLGIIHLDVLITPLNATHNGFPGGYLVQVQDFTEHIHGQAALRDAQERLARHEKLVVLGQLAGSVAHELRNPLTAISNAVFFLQATCTDVNETTKEYLSIITTEMHKSEKIVRDLLNFSRTGLSEHIEREEIGISMLVAQVLMEQSPPEQVEVSTEIPSSLPPVFVDPQQIRQVLANLIRNACQAMPSGGTLTIKARLQQDKVELSIIDTGAGISEENKAKLFEPLFTTKTKGIGLGLAVSKNLVEANGGSIQVKSEEGRGSTFIIRLPYNKDFSP